MSTILSFLLDKATKPDNHSSNHDIANQFCEQMLKEVQGCASAVSMIIGKLKTYHPSVCLQALVVLDICTKKGGKNFITEIGKYKFLNELIRLLSPKYEGSHVPESVKKRISELISEWSSIYVTEPKIKEAYNLLKSQNLIPENSSPKKKTTGSTPNELFDNEQSRLFTNLLKSSKVVDLEAANKLIKNLVNKEEEKMKNVHKRMRNIENANNLIKVLSETMAQCNPQTASHADIQLIKEIYEECLKARPLIFKETTVVAEEKDYESELMQLLECMDKLSYLLEKCKKEYNFENTDEKIIVNERKPKESELIDLNDLNLNSNNNMDLMNSLFLQNDQNTDLFSSNITNQSSHIATPNGFFNSTVNTNVNPPPSNNGLNEIDFLVNFMLEKKPDPTNQSLNSMKNDKGASNYNYQPTPNNLLDMNSNKGDVFCDYCPDLSQLNIISTTMQPVYNRDFLIVNLSYAKVNAPNYPFHHFIFNSLSTNSNGVDNFKLEVSAKKNCQLKMCNPSGRAFTPFNCFSSPPVITQLLLAKIDDFSTNFKIKISYEINKVSTSEVIETSNFNIGN